MEPLTLGLLAVGAWVLLGSGGTSPPVSSGDRSTVGAIPASAIPTVRAMLAESARWNGARTDRLPQHALDAVLVANARWESGFAESAVGDGGASVGLFQINTNRGLGADVLSGALPLDGGWPGPLTRDALFDPTLNTRAVLSELGRTPAALDALKRGTLGEAVDAFVRYIERPRDPAADSARRTAYAVAWSGSGATTPTARMA